MIITHFSNNIKPLIEKRSMEMAGSKVENRQDLREQIMEVLKIKQRPDFYKYCSVDRVIPYAHQKRIAQILNCDIEDLHTIKVVPSKKKAKVA